MEARTIKVVSTQSVSKPVEFLSTATNYGDLKKEMIRAGVKLDSSEVVNSHTRETYNANDVQLPTTDVSLMVVPVKVKLGARQPKDEYASH